MEPRHPLPYSQEPSTCPSWTRSIQSMLPHPTSRRSILISSHLLLCLPSGLLPSGFLTKTLYAPLLSPYVLHALPISVFLVLSPEWYFYTWQHINIGINLQNKRVRTVAHLVKGPEYLTIKEPHCNAVSDEDECNLLEWNWAWQIYEDYSFVSASRRNIQAYIMQLLEYRNDVLEK